MIFSSVQSILVVAAHPDDEVLGCGASLARFASAGRATHVAFLADGVGARTSSEAADSTTRKAAADSAAKILGVRSVEHFDLPDNRLDTVPLLEITKLVESLIAKHRPDIVMTHHAGDVNIDHRRAHQAVVTACRPQPSSCVRGIFSFEVPSSTEWQPPASAAPFAPNLFVDVSAFLAHKRRAMEAYAHEMRAWPHSRSYEAAEHLARWRGASVGCEAAEAFVVLRFIERA
jgi:LmbE family N-acetylglucosaminyl deacetylase